MPRSAKGARSAAGDGTIRRKTVKQKGKENVHWEARYTVGYDPKTGKQVQKTISGRRQKEVAQKLRTATSELDQGTYQEPVKMLYTEWLDIWLEHYTAHLKPRALDASQCHVKNHIRPALGMIPLYTLRTHTIQAFYNSLLKKGLAPKTISIIHGVLHKSLQQAVAIGYLRANPADHCVLPKVRRKPIKPLDDEAIRQFMEAVKGHRFERL